MRFQAWLNTEADYDFLCWMASLNGTDYSGDCISGDSEGWGEWILDLSSVPYLGDVLGEENVWVGFRFVSDATQQYPEGAYVDDIVLRKCTTGNCTDSTGMSIENSPTLVTVPMQKTR